LNFILLASKAFDFSFAPTSVNYLTFAFSFTSGHRQITYLASFLLLLNSDISVKG